MLNILASWKTSTVGIAAIITAFAPMLGLPVTPELASTIALALTGIIGLFSKDANVTGKQ